MTAGSQAVFPGTARNLLLSLGGVIQEPDTNFTISGSTLTFTTAPVANTTFFAVIFGDMQSTGTPSDGTVLPASIASSGNFSFPQLTVTGTSSLGDDVTFTGANYNVVWDKSDNALEFADNAKAKFGTGNDLEIYHSGSHSIIAETGTGILYLGGNQVQLYGSGTNDILLKAVENGTVELYYDNSKKLETTSDGATISGITTTTNSFRGNDNVKLDLGTGSDLQIYHDGSNSRIHNATGSLIFRTSTLLVENAAGNENIIYGVEDGAVQLYHNGSKKLETTSTGATITGNLIATGNLNVNDNGNINVGNSGDLQLFHNGTNSFIDSDTGNLVISSVADLRFNSADYKFMNTADNETLARFIQNGAVELYHDNSKKFETTSTGAHVIGTLEGDNFKVSNPGNNAVLIQNPANGIIGFGANNQTNQVIITADGHLSIPVDDKELRFGASDDLKIYHSGNFNFIVNYNSKNLAIQAKDGENAIVTVPDGTVQLYYDHTLKFATTSSGVTISGGTVANGHITLPDHTGSQDGKLRFGASTDFEIFHNGVSNNTEVNHITNTGHLQLTSNRLKLMNYDGPETYIDCISNGAVELYYNNSKKLETYSQGISLSGNCKFPDGSQAIYGNSSDMEIYHIADNTNVIRGSGPLTIQSDDNVNFNTYSGGELMGKFIKNGAFEAYYDNSKKFETTTSGGQVNGSLTLTSHLVLGNNDEIKLGSASQMTIWHSGSDFNMYNNTGNLIISNASGTGVGEGALVFKSGNNNTRWTITSGGDFVPASNNAFAIGSSSNRVSIIYSNAALNTSDKTLKNTITTSDLGLDFINKLKPVSYKWNQYEGEISDTRTHYGLIAQDVEEVITSSGKTLNDFGGVDKPDEGCMGLAYSQFISPLIKAVQELSAKVETLETKVAALEAA